MSLLSDLIAYYKLEELSGTREDSQGTNDLTDNNTVTQGTGLIGNCASFFSGDSEYLSVANNANLQIGDEDFSFACWVKLDSLGASSRHVFAKYTGGGPTDQDVRLTITTSGEAALTVSDGTSTGFATTSTNSVISGDDNWYFLYVEHDSVGNTISVSVNNATPTSTAYTAGAGDRTGSLYLGRGSQTGTDFFWEGLIDEFGFWKRTLTTEERTALYNSGGGYDLFPAVVNTVDENRSRSSSYLRKHRTTHFQV